MPPGPHPDPRRTGARGSFFARQGGEVGEYFPPHRSPYPRHGFGRTFRGLGRCMARQLDILAIEPFYGGVRRNMLEAMVRCSRHRWNVLKLPARRVERRLTSAARWFAELLSL